MPYELDSEFPDNDPGNALRAALKQVEIPNEDRAARNLEELLYTAQERSVLNPREPGAMLRLVVLAQSITTKRALERFRM